MLRTVTRTEAEQQIRELLDDVARGETVIITTTGRPAFRLERMWPEMDAEEIARREKAKRELLDRIGKQPALHLGRFNRDDAYDD